MRHALHAPETEKARDIREGDRRGRAGEEQKKSRKKDWRDMH